MVPLVIFWTCVGVILFTYVGYPLLLWLLVRLGPRPSIPEMSDWPALTILIVAFNEEDRIARKITNLLACDYPADKLELIVCSDGSTDNTNRIVSECGDPRVRLAASPTNIGVNDAFAMGVQQASNDLLLLTNSYTEFAPDALKKAIRHFADPRVGMVAGQIVYRNPLKTAVGSGYRAYWLIETGVRCLERRLGVATVVVGSSKFLRRAAYIHVPSRYDNDIAAPMYANSLGFLCRCEPESVQHTTQKKTPAQDLRRRIRMAIRGWSSVPYILGIVPFRRNLKGWLALACHKYLRWSTWLFMVAALAACIPLAAGGLFYLTVLGLQVMFYAAALAGWMLSGLGARARLLWLPFYFCLLQAAGMIGLIHALSGRQVGVWKPSK